MRIVNIPHLTLIAALVIGVAMWAGILWLVLRFT